MIRLSNEGDTLIVLADPGDLAARHENQLAFWGFRQDSGAQRFIIDGHDAGSLLPKLVAYFDRAGLSINLAPDIELFLQAHKNAGATLQAALENGSIIKSGAFNTAAAFELRSFAEAHLARVLKDHQYKAALHLLQTENGANFSVPGSGKTTVVLTVFQRLKELDLIDSLFVVGPPACFGPWRTEYKAVLGIEPDYEVLAGGNVDNRRDKYLANNDTVCNLYLTTFQTLQKDWDYVRVLFQRQGVRFYLVVDEAHYIKQIDGAWANAVLAVAKHASRRCILTGTPFPRSYSDAFNLFDVLWPDNSPLSSERRRRIELHVQRDEMDRAAELLDSSIGPLFYRVRKSELNLAPQVFNPPVRIQMNHYERLVYDSILDRIKNLSQSDYLRNLDLLVRLHRGRMMRLRQCLSYTALLSSAVTNYRENLVKDASLSDIIKHYDHLEMPGKLKTTLDIVSDLRSKGEKVVIWSNFVRTLKLLREHLRTAGHGVELIYGGTPINKVNVKDEMTREEIIQHFVDESSGTDILLANPAACAESVSLHKTCSHAIYYDMSYNCAQYIQSLDRIHRVGGSEDKPSYYYFLQYEDTTDDDILTNVLNKAANMSAIIDRDYPIYSLDMFEEDEELQAYERLFGK